MSDIKNLQEKIAKFVQERDWSQFHNPKDLAISLSLESAEVLEHFQWKNGDEILRHIKENSVKTPRNILFIKPRATTRNIPIL